MAANFGTSNTTRYIALTSLALPNSDWGIIFPARIPITSNTDLKYCLVCIGNASNNIATDSGAMFIGIERASGSGDPFSQQLYVHLKDDSGNQPGNRAAAANWLGESGVTSNLLTGPRTDITNDMASRDCLYAVTRTSGVLSLWTCYPGVSARVHSYDPKTTMVGIAAKSAVLGARQTLALTDFCDAATTIGWFALKKGTVTQRMLEDCASGKSPVASLSLTNAAGDDFWDFSGTSPLVLNQTIKSAIPGRSADASVVGTGWASSTDIFSQLTPIVDNVRVKLMDWGQVINAFSATADIPVSGTFAIADYTSQCDIDIQLVDQSDGTTVLLPWTEVASNVTGRLNTNGTWSGTLRSVPRSTSWYTMQVRLRRGTRTTANLASSNKFGVGVTLCWIGQSLARKIKDINPEGIATGAAVGKISSHAASNLVGANVSTLFPTGWRRNDRTVGMGEVRLAEQISIALGCVVGSMNLAVLGSAISSWLATPSADYYDPFLVSCLENLPGFIIWHQGHGSTGDGYTLYGTELRQLFSNIRRDLGSSPYLGILVMNNNQDPNQNQVQFHDIHRSQIDTIRQMILGGTDDRLLDYGCVVDTYCDDTIHIPNDNTGYGRYVERMLPTMLKALGASTYDGKGPRVAGIENWTSGGTTLDVVIGASGDSTDTQSPLGSGPSGFRVATDLAMTQLKTISSVSKVSTRKYRITLSAAITTQPYVDYQYGAPGTVVTVGGTALSRTSNVVTAGINSHGRAIGDEVQMLRQTDTSFSGVVTIKATSFTANSFTYDQTGADGTSGNGTMVFGQSNPIYDNRVPLLNTTLGFPVQKLSKPMTPNKRQGIIAAF